MSDDVTVLETEAPLRHDVKPAGAAPKRRGRPPKVRHDTAPEAAAAPMNGYGDPFTVKLTPGWVAYWVTDQLLARVGRRRKWELATWGDPRIVEYDGVSPEGKGRPIKFNELSCYLMREEDHLALHEADPKRQNHKIKMSALYAGTTSAHMGGGLVLTSKKTVENIALGGIDATY